MKYYTRMFALSAAIAAICGAQPALAAPVGSPLPFAAYDKDANGVVTQQEFTAVQAQQRAVRDAAGAPLGGAANAPSFAVLDLNSDGQVTLEEFNTVQPPAAPAGAGTMGSGVRMGLSDGSGGVPSFADLDENHDGSISAAEFNDARANRAVEKSQAGQPLGSLRNAPPFGALDTNGDGRISPEEFATAQAKHPDAPPPPAVTPVPTPPKAPPY
ncbi:EF-hand domain-containing protein [uncultured Thiodictyon sp.]|uniref:EF-hand domain-containing protein n=1 Tax=uncultured Thiodictyon sp. TaxID=1846217 RepID=UPI0025F717EF|nr:EF-hand domain-containing protein [uncultured Thiodictyon sp.]